MNKIEIILFFILFICFAYFPQRDESTTHSRLILTYSIVDYHTLRVDHFYQDTCDTSFWNGHFYSNKSPGPSFLAIPFYWVIKKISPEADFDSKHSWLSLFIIALPAALLGVIIYKFLYGITADRRSSCLVTLAYALATPAFAYSTMFYGHQLAAVFAFAAFYLLFRNKNSSNSCNSWFQILLAGFLAGWAVLCEFPAGLILLGLVIYILSYGRLRGKIGWFFLGVSLPILLLCWYNWQCFGNPFSLSYGYHVSPFCFTESEKGFYGVTYPNLVALYGITLSAYRGLFFFSPVLFLAIPGFYYFYKRGELKREFWLFLAIVVGFFLFNASFYGWWGGWSCGPRYIVPILPFLAIPIIFCLPRFKFSFRCLGALSFFIVSSCVIVRPQLPDKNYNPLFTLILPKLIRGEFEHFNLGNLIFGLQKQWSLLPWILIFGILCFFLNHRLHRLH